MIQLNLTHLAAAYVKAAHALVSLWHFLPYWLRVVIVVLVTITLVFNALQIIFGKNRFARSTKRIAEHCFHIAASIQHNYGNIIGDTISAIALIGFGLSLAAKLQGHHTIWFWITSIFSIYRAIDKHVKISTTGREFKVFFENRAGAAQAIHVHNEKYPPHQNKTSITEPVPSRPTS